LRFINRNFDGSENNPRHPHYGARGNPLLRLTEPNYEDGHSEPLKRVPSPRDVSNILGDIKDNFRANNMLTQLFTTWSQFVGNDITFTPTQANEHLNIPVPRCDAIFDKFCTGKQDLNFARSIYQVKRRARTNINTVSSWLDASHIYGTDQKTADSLREFKGGKLKVGASGALPKAESG
jgi:peroxidase